MRTTLTIDEDVAIRLDELRRTRDVAFRTLVNEALRLGLKHMAAPSGAKKKPFRTQAFDLGGLKTGSLDNIADVLALTEDETFR
jgi:hypothetical protein